MKENPCYVSAKQCSALMVSQLLRSILMEYLSRTTAIHSMEHKIGHNPFIVAGMLNQRLMLIIHQSDGFVYKLICIHIFLEYTKSQSYEYIN